ncbi:hypothetical protein T265_03346 [Opisthorchis viverrini]|uniref:Uncharacterized protein n=1 Tax=Opisthorchis viverrini TaxID=6198 RepID=A0A074ZWE3_OPIVI|nr:hypothetical protein T265_03346 [Opisthorchis viverrini]KER30192.1 hypothetical protein T265_03346 [Opisthorchis viverrini]
MVNQVNQLGKSFYIRTEHRPAAFPSKCKVTTADQPLGIVYKYEQGNTSHPTHISDAEQGRDIQKWSNRLHGVASALNDHVQNEAISRNPDMLRVVLNVTAAYALNSRVDSTVKESF